MAVRGDIKMGKKLNLLVWLVLLSSFVSADIMDATGMMGYGMKGAYSFSGSLLAVIYFALISLIFSVIFWSTHNWLVKDKKRLKK